MDFRSVLMRTWGKKGKDKLQALGQGLPLYSYYHPRPEQQPCPVALTVQTMSFSLGFGYLAWKFHIKLEHIFMTEILFELRHLPQTTFISITHFIV